MDDSLQKALNESPKIVLSPYKESLHKDVDSTASPVKQRKL